jgi:hypothetical protein
MPAYVVRVLICKPFKETRNRFPFWRNRFHGLLKLLQIRAQATYAGGIDSLESTPELPKRLQIQALDSTCIPTRHTLASSVF